MSLLVETGLGIVGAEAYSSVAATDAFWALRGGSIAWAGATVPDKEAALRRTADYLDTFYLSGPGPYTYGQGLSYPYEGEYDVAKNARVARASMLLAPVALLGPLAGGAPAEATVLSRTEKIGELSESTTYAHPSTLTVVNGVDLSFLDGLLSSIRFGGGIVVGRRVT